MPIEIERKFLVCGDAWREMVTTRKRIQQGYLAVDGGHSTRVRIVDGATSTLTIKSTRTGLRRLEFEYVIPLSHAEQLMPLCQFSPIEKVRHIIPWQGLTWEIDEFEGCNAGLIVAEIELDHEARPFDTPHWIGTEVTGWPQYYNSNLIRRPFKLWGSGVDQRQPARAEHGDAAPLQLSA